VLVPAAGGPAGVNTIKSLKIAGFKGSVIATDANPLSAGFFIASDHIVMPRASDEKRFVEKLFDSVVSKKVQLLMPTSQTDGYVYSKHRKDLENLGAYPVISDTKTMDICIDKLLTFSSLAGKFDLPFTTMDPDKVQEFPAIAKPRFGKGSRDVFKIDDEADLRYVTSKHSDMLFQEFLPGMEYTVDVLSDLDINPLIAVPRTRIETKGGISSKGRVVHHPGLEETCMKMAKSIGIRGPCCIQMKESNGGELKLVEINPRLGGGTFFATLAGVNFPSMIVDMVEGKTVDIPQFSEITVIRYFEEIVVGEKVESAHTCC
jgi:carbamoyl-phosphate synthase large subunit